MALTTMPLTHEDEVVEEVVPVSSWAKQGLTPRAPHPTSSTDLIQYGPLTAQGNFLSHLDNRHSQWQPLPSDVAIGDLSSGIYFDDPTAPSAVPYNQYTTAEPPSLDHWTDMNGFTESSYGLYAHHPQIDSDSFQHVSLSRSFYDLGSAAPLQDFVPTPSFERQTLGPWEGIWAFNPNNVAENFVYPSSDAPPSSMAGPPLSSLPNGLTHISTSERATNGEQYSPHQDNSTSPRQPVPGDWVVVSRPSPSHSEPTRAIPESTPPSSSEPFPSGRRSSDVGIKAKTLKPEKTKRNKTMQVQLLVPRRQGPLSVEQRQKADDMRYYGACWRCRRYKKPVRST
jgi:hypothetical protein